MTNQQLSDAIALLELKGIRPARIHTPYCFVPMDKDTMIAFGIYLEQLELPNVPAKSPSSNPGA